MVSEQYTSMSEAVYVQKDFQTQPDQTRSNNGARKNSLRSGALIGEFNDHCNVNVNITNQRLL